MHVHRHLTRFLAPALLLAAAGVAADEISRAKVRVCEQPTAQRSVKDSAEISAATARPAAQQTYGGGRRSGSGIQPVSGSRDAQEVMTPPFLVDDEKQGGVVPAIVDGEQIDTSDGIDVNELVALAIANHPSIGQANQGIVEATGLQIQSMKKANPTVGYVGAEIGRNTGQHGVFVSQQFIRRDKLKLNGQVYASEVERMQHAANAERLRVSIRVRNAYYELVYARRYQMILTRLADVIQHNHELAQSRFEADEIPKSDVLQAKIEAQQVSLRLRNARFRTTAAERQLASAVGIIGFDTMAKVVPPAQPAPERTFEAVLADLVQGSPELAIASSAVKKAKYELQRARVEPRGNISAQLSMQYDTDADSAIGGVQVGMPIAIHDDNGGNIQAANSQYVRACREQQRLVLQLQQRLATAFVEYEVALESRTAITRDMLPLAKENLQLTTELFEQGETDFQSLLAAQRSYLSLSLSLLKCDVKLWKTVVSFSQFLVQPASSAEKSPQLSQHAIR